MTCMIPATMLPPPTPMEEVYNVNINDPVLLLQMTEEVDTVNNTMYPIS